MSDLKVEQQPPAVPSNQQFNAFAPYYDLLYADKDYTGEARWVHEQITQHSNLSFPGPQMLDLGCGTGQHMVELQKCGYTVHGVDASPAMVEIARGKGLSVEVADVTTYNDNAAVHYDAVIALFHVASYLSDIVQLQLMIDTARRHLKSGGLLIFDFWYGPSVLSVPPEERVKSRSDAYTSVVRIARPYSRPLDSKVTIEYRLYVESVRDGTIRKLCEIHSLRYWFMSELQDCLSGAGFKLLDARLSAAYDGKIVARCS